MKPPVKTNSWNEEQERLNRVVAEAFQESDRAGAVLLGAELDNILRVLLEHYLLVPAQERDGKLVLKKDADSIYKKDGFAGSFSNKIELCFRLGFIDPISYHDLGIIRKIRNEFAHGMQGLSLDDDQLKDWCANLAWARDIEEGIRMQIGPKEVQDKFKLAPKQRLLLTGTRVLTVLSLTRLQIKKAQICFPAITQMTNPDAEPSINYQI